MDERNADRIRTILLLGVPGVKRTTYFQRAAHRLDLPFTFLDWEEWARRGLPPAEEYYIKIDPPAWDSCVLDRLDVLVSQYRNDLAAISQTPGASYLNHPRAILDLLDKRRCKQRLAQAGLPVTQTLAGLPAAQGPDQLSPTQAGPPGAPANSSQLLEAMKSQGIFQVFLKPVWGSGAAGTAAFRYQPRTGRMALYTCALRDPVSSRLLNTKRLRCFTEPREILDLLDGLLALDCLVERWYSKADHEGCSYDLRAVVQEGRLDFLLARLSKGPITNLHLNNHPLDASELNLPEHVLSHIDRLCKKAVSCYPGLTCAGIDILLEHGSLRPRIIEMNGQGDLLYQDIYKDNSIYLHQAQMMKGWLLTGGPYG